MQVHLQDIFRALGFATDSQILVHGMSVEAADTHIQGAPMQSHTSTLDFVLGMKWLGAPASADDEPAT